MLVGPLDAERRKEYVPSKSREPITPWRVVISQKNGVLNHTSMKTSRLDTLGIIWKHLVMSRNRPFDEKGNCVPPLWRNGLDKLVTVVIWPREETSSRHWHEKKSDHFFKWAFLKVGCRFHYSATVECKVFENSHASLNDENTFREMRR